MEIPSNETALTSMTKRSGRSEITDDIHGPHVPNLHLNADHHQARYPVVLESDEAEACWRIQMQPYLGGYLGTI